MKQILIAALVFALPACSPRPASLPPDWTSVLPPEEGSEQAQCVNWAVDEWTVETSADGASLQVARAIRNAPEAHTIAVQGGRLVAENHGEFGGDVWWEPEAGQRQTVAKTNLVAFIPTGSGLFGLAGLAHLIWDVGWVVRFDQRPDGSWEMHTVLDLGAAPYAFALRRDGTVLVALTGKVALVRLPNEVTMIYRNRGWRSLYPNSIAEDRAGRIYVGTRSGVARLMPEPGGFFEDWLVPSNCTQRRVDPAIPLGCRCVPGGATQR